MKTLFNGLSVKRFNFTYALTGGAWLESESRMTSDGMKSESNWFSFETIRHHLGLFAALAIVAPKVQLHLKYAQPL